MTITTETTPLGQETTPLDPRIQPLTDRQLRSLLANLNQNRISTRKQGNSNLSYLEAWDVKAALIKVFGFGGFSAVTSEAQMISREEVTNSYGKKAVRITVMVRMVLTIHQLGAVYGEYAAASQTGQDPGDVLDFAIKTAESDALKRCAINLGTQFGLSLYNDGSTTDVVKISMGPGQEWPRPAEQAPTQPAIGGPAAQMFPTPAEGVTPEQHQKNVDLVNQAFSVKAKQQQQASPAKQEEQLAAIASGYSDGSEVKNPEEDTTPAVLEPAMAGG